MSWCWMSCVYMDKNSNKKLNIRSNCPTSVIWLFCYCCWQLLQSVYFSLFSFCEAGQIYMCIFINSRKRQIEQRNADVKCEMEIRNAALACSKKQGYPIHVLAPCALTMNVIRYLVFGVCFYFGLNFLIMDPAQWQKRKEIFFRIEYNDEPFLKKKSSLFLPFFQ